MSGKIFVSTISFLIGLVGCAQPRYEKVINQNTSANTDESQKVTACPVKFAVSGYCLFWQWEIMPTSEKAGSLLFKIVRANNLDQSAVPVDVGQVPAVTLWMPSMGHGSTPTTIEQFDLGSFRASEVYFIMPGDWEIRFQIKDSEVVRDEAIVSLTI